MIENGRNSYKDKTEGNSNTLAFVEGTQPYPSKMLKEIRQDIVSEVGELLPQSFKFVRTEIQVSAIQEEKLRSQKCIREEESGKVFSLSIQVHNSLKKDSREISTQSSSKKSVSLNPSLALKDCQDAFEKTTRQIQCEVELLHDIQLAQAKLHSLEEIPSHRPWYGRANFTCTNCHYKGHKTLHSTRMRSLQQVWHISNAFRSQS